MYLLYDMTFDGLLSAIAWCFRRQIRADGFITEFDERPLLEPQQIPRERGIRELFRRHLADRLGPAAGPAVLDTVYQAYLSEATGIATQIWLYLERALQLRQDPAPRLYEPPVAAVVGAARRVGGQAHQYLGLLRFRQAGPSFYIADFMPDYHVLPLILPHFADRLSDQNFVIRDLRRHLAALHPANGQVRLFILADDGEPLPDPWPTIGSRTGGPGDGTTRIAPSLPPAPLFPSDAVKTGLPEPGCPSVPNDPLPATGTDYADLWRLYLQRLTIPERRNPALQQANMPRKYWKYLTENPLDSQKRDRSW